MKLSLAPDCAMPAEAITQTFGVLGIRGSGKSNAAAVMVEEMHRVKLPFVVVDPVGSWYGLRSSGDGKGPGLPIPIFGGRHGDVPLEKTGGAVLADLIVEHRLSCVLDISEFSEGDKTRFLIDFAERLYRKNEQPLHLVLEEADDYIPQRPFREQARCLRAWENIVRRGRARGLGMTMITQRSAAINKNVLTQIETLIVLRTTSPQDRKAVEAWVEYHGQSRELLESLPGLENGEAWVWSPHWLGALKRVRIRRRETFDSAATPKDVKGTRPPATLADVDLGAVRQRMAATIERAKAEDPRELRRQIAELRVALTRAKAPATAEPQRVEVPVFSEQERRLLSECQEQLAALERDCSDGLRQVHAKLDLLDMKASERLKTTLAPRFAPSRPPAVRPITSDRLRSPVISGGAEDLGKGERIILTAVAQYPDGASREQLTILTGYKRSSRDTYLQRLAQRELVAVTARGELAVTDKGMAALGPDFEPLPTGRELQAYWLNRLTGGERAILEALIRAYPKAVDREAISSATEYARSSRDTYIQRLAARRLVVAVGRGEVRASETLMEG